MDIVHNWAVVALRIVSTTQLHLAKALERQGIKALDAVRARLGGSVSAAAADAGRTRLIYAVGLLLNHTTFVYHLLVTPLGGTTAQYTSMFGLGLLALLAYSHIVLHERLSRRQWWCAWAILVGTVAIGVEGLGRPCLRMAAMAPGRNGRVVVALGAIMGGFVLLRGSRWW